MSASFFNAGEQMLSATANGVYQGVLVAALAGLALRFLVRTNAATRHAVWSAVLLFVTALIPAHLLLSFLTHGHNPAAALLPRPSTTATVPVASFGEEVGDLADANTDMAAPQSQDSSSEESGAARPALETKQEQDEQVRNEPVIETAGTTAAPEETQSTVPSVAQQPSAWNLRKDITLPHSLCLGLIFAWILLAGVRGFLLVRQILEVRRVKRNSTSPGPALQMVFDKLRASLARRRHVQAKISNAHRTAGLLGFFHPVILLPAEMDNDLDQIEAEHVLRHELAHVERRDDWGNLAQQFIQAALFFHPAVWWISGRLSVEREIACDDHVLEASGRPRAYALTLANVASRMSQSGHLLAPGVFHSNSQLKQRITMILNTQRNRSPRLARRWLGLFTTATALLALLAVTAGPRLVLAQPSPTADGAPAALPPDTGDTSSGPRLKTPGSAATSLPAPAVAPTKAAEPPEPPEPPEAATPQGVNGLPPVPPVPMAAMVAMTAPAPAPFGQTTGGATPSKQMTVEERLDRIERILGDLQARGAVRGKHRIDANSTADGFSGGAGGTVSVNPLDEQSINRAAQEAKRAAEEVRRAVEAGERAAAAGQRAAEAGQRAAEQAMRDVEKLKNKNFDRRPEDWKEAESERSQMELQALRQARESLQNQVRSLERQIQQLEKGQKHGKPEQNDKHDDGSKDEKPEPKAS